MNGFSKEFSQDSLSAEYMSFDENVPQPPRSQAGRDGRPPLRNKKMENGKRKWKHRSHSNRNVRFTGNSLNSGAKIKCFH